VITGLMSRTEARTLGGIAGLSSIPVVGNLLSNNTRSNDHTETILVIKPRLLNLPPEEFHTPLLLTGTETKPLSLL
jgi:type II secretory pathway component GspD/PulD (secretin)